MRHVLILYTKVIASVNKLNSIVAVNINYVLLTLKESGFMPLKNIAIVCYVIVLVFAVELV